MSALPTHEQLLVRGFESLGDGVYVRETPEGLELFGNGYERPNAIWLEPRVYAALRRFAQAHGYEAKPSVPGASALTSEEQNRRALEALQSFNAALKRHT